LSTEKEYIIRKFKDNFEKHKDARIFLYGISLNTKLILDEFTDYNILGLLDGHIADTYMYDKYVYNINDIYDKNPDMIIIIARTTSVNIIYRRIAEFCKKNNIAVYDINHTDLLNSETEYNVNDEYFDVSSENLKEKILSHDVISFDIFDTLIMRRVLFPDDVFDIVTDRCNVDFDFKSERIKAEQQLYQTTNPDLDEIYEVIRMNNPNVDTEFLKNEELKVEKDVLIKREEIAKILNFAVSQGKKVYLISDMYLDKTILNSILNDLGIQGYDDIFVSCEFKKAKSCGLFDIFKEKVSGTSYLHIGDNKEADGDAACKSGIDSFILKSAYDMVGISSYSKILNYTNDFDQRLHIGIFISEVFNNPFSMYKSGGRASLNEYAMIGVYIAPVVTDFLNWLIHKVEHDNCENIILVARDGYVLSKMLDCITEQTKTKHFYFLTSRISALSALMYKKEYIDYILNTPYSGTLKDMMTVRCGIDISEFPTKLSSDELIYIYMDEITEQGRKNKANYLKYINSLGIDFSKNTAYVDFVSSGTCQMCLEDLLDIKLIGYYFIKLNTDNEKKNRLYIQSFQNSGYAYELKSNLYNKYMMMESIFTSYKPTLKGFNDEGQPIYFEEYRSEDIIQSIKSIHEKMINYYIVYKNLCKNMTINEYNELSDIILGMFDEKYTHISEYIFKTFIIKDDFNGAKF